MTDKPTPAQELDAQALEELTPCAKWTDDCSGKKDYDGRLISISTRYWRDFTAVSHIVLNHGEPDQYGYGDYTNLTTKEFKGENFADVKSQVEAWVQTEFDRVRAALSRDNSQAMQEVVAAYNDLSDFLDVDDNESPDEDSIGWTGTAEMPTTFGQIRRLKNAIAAITKHKEG